MKRLNKYKIIKINIYIFITAIFLLNQKMRKYLLV